MLTREQIQRTVTQYFADKPVERVYLFGSYARGEATEESDVDLLIDVDRAMPGGWASALWPDDLTQLLKTPTDVVTNVNSKEQTSNWPFIQRVNQEKLLVYERQ